MALDGNHDLVFQGLDELTKDLEEYLKGVDNVQEVLEVGAKEFTKDLLKLPRPISRIRKSGYTHLIDSFSYRKAKNNEVEVGWGKYYGRMVESGTIKMNARPHLKPTWEQNQNKYYSLMLKRLGH
jgi:HK97 gp10 family phage protein